MTKQNVKNLTQAACMTFLLLLLLCLAGCKSGEQGQNNGDDKAAAMGTNQAQSKDEESEENKKSEADKKNSKESYDDLTMLNSNHENYCDTGYYFLEEDEHQKIKYIDYETRQEIYLCNKPNCKHDNQDCSAYVDDSCQLYVYKDSIYLVSSWGEVYTASIDEEGELSQGTEKKAPVIYRMNLDGTGKEKIFELPAGMEIAPQVISGKYLYAFFRKSESVQMGSNSYTSVEKEKNLSVINLETGKWEKLMDGKNKNIVGVYKGNLIMTETIYQKDPDEFLNDDEGWLENLKNSDISMTLYSLENKKEEKIVQVNYDKMQEIICDGKFVYFLRDNSSAIDCLDLETKKVRTVKELQRERASLVDGKEGNILYLYYDQNSNEGQVKEAYVVNAKTGESKEFTLLDEDRTYAGCIAENNEYYLVITGYDMTDYYKTWAGTMQRDIERVKYGLIAKENYWNSVADYIEIK